MAYSIRVISMLLLLAVAATLATATAQDRDGPRFDRIGVIQRVDLQREAIVVSDSYLRLGPDARIYGPDGERPRALWEGMKVGIRLKRAGSRNTISELWLLPPGYEPDRRAED